VCRTNDSAQPSKRKRCDRSCRRRQREYQRQCHRQKYILQDYIVQQEVVIQEQELEIIELKQQIQKYHRISKIVDSDFQVLVNGIFGIKNHIKELDCQETVEIKQEPLW